MKKKMMFTCAAMIPPACLAQLSERFRVDQGSCAMDEEGLKLAIRDVDVAVIGGGELYTLDVVKVAKPTISFIFLGSQPETFFTKEAREFLKGNAIPVYATGGGLASVVSKTVDLITDYDMLSARMTRIGQWTNVSAEQLLKTQVASVIGSGNIGLAVMGKIAGKCKLVKYYARKRSEIADQSGALFVASPPDAFDADVVTLHLRYVPGETDSIITYDVLNRIRAGGLFINNARAELLHKHDVLKFLKARKDVMFLWDVFWKEGKAFENCLDDMEAEIIRMPNFTLTPHRAAQYLPETTAEEYCQGLLRVIEENHLI